MLSEEKIAILNRMKINSPELYEKALEMMNLSDSDIPERKVTPEHIWRQKQPEKTDKRVTYYLGGRPYFGIPPAGYQDKKSIASNTKTEPEKKEIDEKPHAKKSASKKKNTALFIDGENISCKKAKSIIGIAKEQGVIYSANVYYLQNDPSTAGWGKVTDLKDIRLYGEPEKDKVDKKIQKDAIRSLKNDLNVDIFCIATSDGGFERVISELRQHGKRVVLICESKAPDKLRKAANKVKEV